MTPDAAQVDWLALSPVLALLGASGARAARRRARPAAGARRGFAALVRALGFADRGGVLAALRLSPSSGRRHRDRRRDPRATGSPRSRRSSSRARACSPSHVSYARAPATTTSAEYYALLAAAGAGMLFLVAAHEPDDALPRARVVLDLASTSSARSTPTGETLARGRPQVPDRRRLRLGDAALRLGARLRRDRRARLRRDRGGRLRAGARRATSCSLAGLALMIAGLGFKASAAPFHMWTPDVYEGAPTPVTGFMAAATKAAALVLDAARADGGVSRAGAPLDGRARRARLCLARDRQPRRARAGERQAAARVLVRSRTRASC